MRQNQKSKYKDNPLSPPFVKGRRGGFFCVLFSVLCILFLSGVAYPQGVVIMAKKVSADLPLDPDNELWQRAPELNIPLFAQVMARPRIYDSSVENIRVRALHNSEEIAFLLEWQDETEDTILDVDRFPDAVAVEFPSAKSGKIPHFGMGDEETPVNIWYWKSIWQTPESQTIPAEAAVKAEEYAPHFRTDEKTHVFVDDWLPGVLAGNPISTPGHSPIENIVANGFGSVTDNEKRSKIRVSGSGRWKDSRWQVVVKRRLSSDDIYDASFREGEVMPVAFAVWNGNDGNRGGRKAISTWYYVALEKGREVRAFILPLIAFLTILGLELYLIRMRRGA